MVKKQKKHDETASVAASVHANTQVNTQAKVNTQNTQEAHETHTSGKNPPSFTAFFFPFLRKNWPWMLVLAFMIFGFVLRAYHMDYPSIGYHNWKENRYLGPARNFVNEGFFKYGFFVPAYDFPKLDADPSGAHSDLFPYSAIFAALMFMLFGFKLWAARLPVVIFSVAAIPLVYMIMKRLFKREDLALTAAFLTAINPLFVFFAHNVDQMPFGLGFVLLGLYFYIRWVEENKRKDFVLATLFLAAGINAKYTYLILGIPMLFIFPWSRLKEWRKAWKTYAYGAAAFSIFPLWLFYSNYVIAVRYKGGAQAKVSTIDPFGNLLTSKFWATMKAYAADNYTLIGVFFAVLGLVALLVFFRKQQKQHLGNRFMLGYAAGVVFYFLLFSQNMAGHTYHQYPIAPAVILFMAYLFVVLGTNAGNIVKSIIPWKREIAAGFTKLIVVLVFILIVYSPSMEAKNRMFDTQFPGLDVAGEYIAAHKKPGERVMHSSHQAYGLLWHGGIKGTRGIPPSLSNITFVENELNARWLFIYNWDFSIFQDQERWPYLSKHYRLRQLGFTPNDQGQAAPLYLLLYRDDRGFNLSSLNDYIKNHPVQSREYEYTYGKMTMYYVNVE